VTLALTDEVALPKPPPTVNQSANPIKSSLLKPNQTKTTNKWGCAELTDTGKERQRKIIPV
jgi:hypothetical protein